MPGALGKEAAQTSWVGDGRKALVQHHVFSKMRLSPQNQAGQPCSAPCLLLLVLTATANLRHFHLPR